MPIKWTPDADQILLLKILETHDITVDTKKVAEAWPQADPSAIPTPRAISERIFKIKKAAKDAIKGAGSTPKKVTAASSKTTTLSSTRKRAANGNGNGAGSPASKRSRVKAEPKMGMFSPPPADNETIRMKRELDEDLDLNFMDSTSLPAKRVRTTPRMPLGLVLDEETDEEKKYETDVSEYVADEAEADEADIKYEEYV